MTLESIAQSHAELVSVVNDLAPFGHRIDVRYLRRVRTAPERGICGDHGRVVPTWQGLCPVCAGYVHDAAQVAKMRELAARLKAA